MPEQGKKQHKNKERTVKCPVDGCDSEVLSRGLHLHVRKTDGNDHGTRDSIPEDIDLDSADAVGTREVEMDYPEKREVDEEARLCPYCERPFRGKHGVMIHLGLTAGRKNHPEDARGKHNPDDFPAVEVDENDNVVNIADEGATMPSTERRQENGSPDKEQVRKHIEELREQGLDEQADRAEEMLFGN
jgi:hypothetical protein